MIGPASETPAPPRTSDTRARLIATPIILGVIGGVLAIQEFTGNALGSHLVLAAFGAAAGAEMALLFRHAGRSANLIQAAVGCGALCAVGLVGDQPSKWLHAQVLVLFGMLLWILLEHLRDTRAEAPEEMAVRLVPILYVGFLLSFMVPFVWDWRMLLFIILTAKVSDMAGWAIGKPFGKHKMIPSVSPGKSWEGTIAGLLASAIVATFLPLALGLFDGRDYPWATLPFFGLLLGAASILAGVTWSGWKRRLQAKDSSTLIPHMGGIMDMVDSLLLAGPAVHLWFYLDIW